MNDITEIGIKARGRKELIAHKNGKRLTQRQAIYAKCFDCMGGYIDGKTDCDMPNCSIHPFMPYRGIKEGKNKEGAILV